MLSNWNFVNNQLQSYNTFSYTFMHARNRQKFHFVRRDHREL